MSHSTKSPQDSIHFEEALEEHDSWFRHSPDEPHHQQAHGDTNSWAIILFMIGTLGLVLVVALVTYYGAFEPLMRQEVERIAEGRPMSMEFVSSVSDGQRKLSSYEWVDPARGVVRVPLDVAKRLQLEEHLAMGGRR